jgi:hypothetical protein
LRIEGAGGWYHVTARGKRRSEIFDQDCGLSDRELSPKAEIGCASTATAVRRFSARIDPEKD